ncbi:sulfite exporter TauE/SafE family protein [Ramlibacter sp. USB13]|uniref:Probable membrane transporter protein n=1 Tax=Ramlibacter cellulosilyticus TaxID=2764187 RepID=A0A923MQL9_9BURK|nr:sulfite exporter TauE/SafE family protein [Ramlibacter cellulosilyticus]MBC5783156.1 sulfite exporter TauE/SafE family protein [Ramlibacter cellulosilyticus]
MDLLLVLVAGLFAGTLGGIVGTGSSLVLMPILVVMFGPRQAVPIMAVAAILGNLGRVLAWRRDIDWRACGAYCVTAVPGAMLGARLLLTIPPGVAETALGVFFLSLIPVRRWLHRHAFRLSLYHLMLLGAPIGLLTGLVVSTGPITVPLFTFYGLERGAFLGTEAAASIGMYGAKVATFQAFGALPLEVVVQGVGVGATLMAGSFAGRFVVLKISPGAYRSLIDGLMLCSGVSLLWAAVR